MTLTDSPTVREGIRLPGQLKIFFLFITIEGDFLQLLAAVKHFARTFTGAKNTAKGTNCVEMK